MIYNKNDIVVIHGINRGHGEEWNKKKGIVVIGGDEWVSVAGHDTNKKRVTVFHKNHLFKFNYFGGVKNDQEN